MDASPIVTDSPRQLGVCHDYDGLHRILRDRADELNVSRTTLDEAAGFTPGHASKLLSPRPLKNLGPVSLGLMLQVMGLKLVVVEDAEALERIRAKLIPREIPANVLSLPWAVRHGAKHFLVSKRWVRKIGRKGGEQRAKNLSPRQRSAIARKGREGEVEQAARHGNHIVNSMRYMRRLLAIVALVLMTTPAIGQVVHS